MCKPTEIAGFFKHSPPILIIFFQTLKPFFLDHGKNASNFRSDPICMLSCLARWRSRLKTYHICRKILRANSTSWFSSM